MATTINISELGNSEAVGWADAKILRNGAGALEQSDGLNPQSWYVYNTKTDAANYERLKIGWNANTLEIQPEAAGTGSNRSMSISANNANLVLKTTSAGVVDIYAGYTNRGRIQLIHGSSGTQIQMSGSGLSTIQFGDTVCNFSGNTIKTTKNLNHKTSSTSDPSTTQFPNDGDFGVHKNTTSGALYLAANDGGTIRKVQLV